MSTSPRTRAARGRADPAQPQISVELLRLLLTLSGRILQHFGARTAEFQLSPGEGKVLLTVDPDEALSMRALARRLHYDASNLTGLVDKLEDRGLLERRADPGDRRAKVIALTDAGLPLREALWQRLITDVGPVKALTDGQLTDLHALLRTALQEHR